mgnify:CR=1 FL=1
MPEGQNDPVIGKGEGQRWRQEKRKEGKEKKGMNLTAIDRPMPERTDQPEGGTDGDI